MSFRYLAVLRSYCLTEALLLPTFYEGGQGLGKSSQISLIFIAHSPSDSYVKMWLWWFLAMGQE